MAEGVLVLEPGDERAKKIGKAMANESATAILSALKEGDLTLSEISERMSQPMTTVKYHVENLLDAELIEVRKIRYSEKGREVKVYGVNDRLVIVAPLGRDVRDALLKYASVFTLLLLATLAMVALSPTFSLFIEPQGISDQDDWIKSDLMTASTAVYETQSNFGEGVNESYKSSEYTLAAGKGQAENMTTSAPTFYPAQKNVEDGVVPPSVRSPGDTGAVAGGIVHLFIIAFFLGGCLILGIMFLYEVVIWRREKKFWEDPVEEDKR